MYLSLSFIQTISQKYYSYSDGQSTRRYTRKVLNTDKLFLWSFISNVSHKLPRDFDECIPVPLYTLFVKIIDMFQCTYSFCIHFNIVLFKTFCISSLRMHTVCFDLIQSLAKILPDPHPPFPAHSTLCPLFYVPQNFSL